MPVARPLHHEGHPGWHADHPNTDQDDIRGGIYGWLASNPADIVLLHIGTNDIDSGLQDANSLCNEVDAILDKIDQYEKDNSKEITVILARIVNRKDCPNRKCEITTQYNILLKNLADLRAENGDKIIVADMEGAIEDYQKDMADILHPNDSGYEKMAIEWFRYLPALCSRSPAIHDLDLLRATSTDNPHNLPTGDLYCEYSLYSGATTAATAWCKNGLPIMVLYMPFEGGYVYGKNTALLDYSGNRNDGDDQGLRWYSMGGFDNKGHFSFTNFKDNYINAGDIMPMEAYTKAAWIKLFPKTWEIFDPNKIDFIYRSIICGGNHAFLIRYNTRDDRYRLAASHNGPPRDTNTVMDPNVFTPGVWTFVAVTYDYYDNERMVLYKDGNLIDSCNKVSFINQNDRRVYIGSTPYGGAYRFKGLIDDVRIYGHALSSEQIKALSINDPNKISGRDRIVSQETSDGDLWHAHVTPFSSLAKGQTYESNILGIGSIGDKEPPKIKALSLASSSGNNLSTDDLFCTYDLAGSATGAITTWYKDGSPLMVLNAPMEGCCKANALNTDFHSDKYILTKSSCLAVFCP